MPITPLSEKKQPLSILIQGPPGSGKTTFCMELALRIYEKTKKKSLFIDSDCKLASQANLTPKHREVIDVWSPPVTVEQARFNLVDKKAPPRVASTYLETLSIINEIPSDPFPYGLVTFDTLTNLAEDLEVFWAKRLGYTQGAKGDTAYAYWDNVGSNLMSLMKELKNIPAITVVNVHIQHEKDEVTGAIVTTPTVRSNKRYTIGKEFAETYVFQGNTGAGFTALVEGNTRYMARTGFSIPKPVAKLEVIQAAILAQL